MKETLHKEEKDIQTQLNEYGMPVFESQEHQAKTKQQLAIEKAYWTGMQRASTIFISYGATPERAVQMRVQSDLQLQRVKREMEGHNDT